MAILGSGSASLAQTQAPLSVGEILDRMVANTKGLTSYVVPVQIEAHVFEGPISLPVRMDGTRYFELPDRSALRMSSVPSLAKEFSDVYSSLGTPLTWPQTFDITIEGTGSRNGHSVVTLQGRYKHPSTVDHVDLDVDTGTFDPVEARWFYRNGATIVMDIQESVVAGAYRLPEEETISVSFPAYKGNATVSYGTYQTNVAIPDSVFGGGS